MTNVQSKCLPVTVSCHEYVHPWTENCWNSAAGQILHSLENSSKIYAVVYMLSLLMRGRIPTTRDLKRTFLGIIQSTGFLVTNGCAYLIFACILRNMLGGFHFWTIAYAPAFLGSLLAIVVERPTRRPLLCLYVANLATETIWRMAVKRNLVHPIRYGETLIFGFSTSVLLYLYKRGLHKTLVPDSLFSVMKFVVDEEGKEIVPISSSDDSIDDTDDTDSDTEIKIKNRKRRRHLSKTSSNDDNANDDDNDDDDDDDAYYADATDGNDEIMQRYVTNNDNNNDNRLSRQESVKSPKSNTNAMNKIQFISNLVKVYENFLKIIKTMPKHKSCTHSNGCICYSIRGGLKLFSVGVGVQIALKLALQWKKIIQLQLKFRKTIFNEGTFKLGLFLGGFSFLYKATSCSFRHLFGKDDPSFAIPAGLIASIAFTKYPDCTIALYVMWKMLQITYNMGIKTGYLPNVPGFTIFLYCASTATLFHAAALEAESLRPSYWKFLSSNSGGRVNHMDRTPFEIYGLNSYEQAIKVQKLTNTLNPKIKFPLS